MRVMVFMIANEDSAVDMTPTPEMLEAFAAMDVFTEELVQAGVMVAGAGLKPPAEGKRIICDGPGRTVIDGPFAESREMVDLGGQGHGRGRGVGDPLPQFHGGSQPDRDPAVLRSGGPGRLRDARGARDSPRR